MALTEMLELIQTEGIKDALKITEGLDPEGMRQVTAFAAGVKARAEYEKQKQEKKAAS